MFIVENNRQKAVIFDIDGTLIDSVDLHARAWQEAFLEFGPEVSFEEARGQICKGGDKLLPVFLTEDEQTNHGEEMEAWRGKLFRSKFLPMIKPFSSVPELLRRIKDEGIRVALASSAKTRELDEYLETAGVARIVEITTSSEDAENSKPSPDIYQAALERLCLGGSETIAVGDSPYDAQAASQAGIATVGVLCGGFSEVVLREGGCVAVYPGPGALLACLL